MPMAAIEMPYAAVSHKMLMMEPHQQHQNADEQELPMPDSRA